MTKSSSPSYSACASVVGPADYPEVNEWAVALSQENLSRTNDGVPLLPSRYT